MHLTFRSKSWVFMCILPVLWEWVIKLTWALLQMTSAVYFPQLSSVYSSHLLKIWTSTRLGHAAHLLLPHPMSRAGLVTRRGAAYSVKTRYLQKASTERCISSFAYWAHYVSCVPCLQL